MVNCEVQALSWTALWPDCRRKMEEGGSKGSQYASERLGRTRVAMGRTMGSAIPKGQANPEPCSQLELRVVTHPHERGMFSNRRSLACGEYVH